MRRRFESSSRASCNWDVCFGVPADADSTKSRSRPVIKEMKVDRPFLFLVFDVTSGFILCGAVVNSIQGS